MKDVAYQLDRAIVTIMAEINEASMVDLVTEIDRLSTDYFYKTIELRIASPGGELLALDYYLDAMRRFRQRGVQIRTRALTQAGSAAASILSLGDGPRTAGRTAALRYHFHRVSAEGDMTARTATALHLLLGQTDRKMVGQIAERAFRGYGRDANSPEDSGRPQRGLDCFAETDWQTMNRLTGRRFDVDFHMSDKDKRACLAAIRKRVAEECEQRSDAIGFLLLYGELFGFDINISAAFACELRLIDGLADEDELDSPAVEPGRCPHSVEIPEWRNLFLPQGEIARADLCRHVMAFGETGSGKTQSAIVPVLKGILRQADPAHKASTPVSCALVIDPKKELHQILASQAPKGVAVRVLETQGNRGDGLQLNLMNGEWAIAEDFARDDMLGTAQKMLKRCASFLPQNPAFESLMGRGAGDNAYWKNQGVRLAQTIIALLLVVFKYRGVIFDPTNINPTAYYLKLKLRTFGVTAGLLAPTAEMAGRAYVKLLKEIKRIGDAARRDPNPHSESCRVRGRWLFTLDERRAFRRAWKEYRARICSSQRNNAALREFIDANGKTFARLAASRLPLNMSEVLDGLQAVAESCWDAACPLLPEEALRPSKNLIALAAIFQRQFFVGGSGKHADEKDQWVDQDGRPTLLTYSTRSRAKHMFLAHRLVEEYLRNLISGNLEIDDAFDEVEYFHSLATVRRDLQHYMGLFGFAKPAFTDFSDSGPAQALFFGCEPFLLARNNSAGSDEQLNMFSPAINSQNGGTVYVYQPSLGHGRDALVARALKAQFFEAVLSDPKRQENGSDMPLVAYVADEFHRFITSDVVHGEQSFFDTCRSFGAFCVVASQSMSSLHHALAGASFTNKDEKAVEILLNNTGTKLFFRTTDRALHDTIDRLCPLTPYLPKSTEVRPPSTLRPGECYAVVTDGRFLRCKIDLNVGLSGE